MCGPGEEDGEVGCKGVREWREVARKEGVEGRWVGSDNVSQWARSQRG